MLDTIPEQLMLFRTVNDALLLDFLGRPPDILGSVVVCDFFLQERHY